MASTVTVACKVPNGLHLDLCDTEGRVLKRVTVRGNAAQRLVERANDSGRMATSFEPVSSVREGFGLTPNVDADFWESWLKQNANYAPVAAGLIFAHATPAYVASKATERAEVMSGMEPINPNGDRRTRGMVKVEGDERHGLAVAA